MAHRLNTFGELIEMFRKQMMQKIQIANKQDPNLPQTVTMDGMNYLPVDCIDSNCKRFIANKVTYTFKKGNY